MSGLVFKFSRQFQISVNPRVKIGGFLLGDQLKEKFKEFTQFTSDERPANPTMKMHAGTNPASQKCLFDVREHS